MRPTGKESSRFGNRTIFIVVIMLLGAGLLVVWSQGTRLRTPEGMKGDPPDVQADDQADDFARLPDQAHLQRMKQLALVGTAHLENERLADAESALLEVVAGLPNQLLGHRNLAISRLIAFQNGTIALEDVEAALEELLALDPQCPVPFWITAKAAVQAAAVSGDSDAARHHLQRAVTALEEAMQLDPDDVVYPFELFEITSEGVGVDEQMQRRGHEALELAYQLAPDNLFVLSAWLLAQAEDQDEQIVETLERAGETILPLRELIGRTAPVDILEMTETARQAALAEDWPAVVRNVRIVFLNLIRPHDFAQSDMRELLPHPLHFVVHDFSPDVEQRLQPLEQDESEPVEVRFARLPQRQQPPPADDVRSVLLVDFNLDSMLDLVVLRENVLEIYVRDEEDAWQLEADIEIPSGMRGVLAADLDHDRDQRVIVEGIDHPCFDADVDFVVWGEPGILVLRNQLDRDTGQRHLQPVPQEDAEPLRGVTAATLVDFDHDSNLDIVVATESGVRALLNDGNMNFTDFSRFSVMPPTEQRFTALVAVDWDRDVDIDVMAAAPRSRAVGYLENMRHGSFRWAELDEPFAPLRSAQSLAVLDSHGNASWDLAGAGSDGVHVVQTFQPQPGVVRPKRAVQLSDSPSRGLLVWDFDNDGYSDILAWGEAGLQFHRGGPDGTFHDAGPLLDDPPSTVLTCDVGDLDGDGGLDLALVTPQGIVLYQNEGGNRNGWLTVRAMGQVDNRGKANHHGIGSLLELKSAGRYQAQVVQRPVSHFGLGDQQQADVLRVLWTNGVPQALLGPQADQVICEKMVLKGSCPYLYAWDGERFTFVTDLLWAAPLGLQTALDQLAPSRNWEYLLIRGDQLRSRNGRYHLRVTEELWEAAYFDQIELIAIDHPEQIEIYSNEKVGPESVAAFQVHTVRQRRLPRAARDKHGRDVLETVRRRDGNYFRGFDEHRVPGLVDQHFLELDLGPLDDPDRITLFLTGWIYPTDTSLNVALSQHPHWDPPQPPAVWVPDEEGRWQEVIPYMGFPGGKTKTIAVDLSDAFLTDDYRLRIVTTNEIYWDEAFFTVDEHPAQPPCLGESSWDQWAFAVSEPPADIRLTRLPLRSAELRERGFSQPIFGENYGPETYDYDRVDRDPKWPPMQGRFTRYGDVRHLLTQTDDRLVVLAPGDELALSFDAFEEEPSPGWTRSFLMYNVGWDKDADLNTVFGQTVEPLPFGAMESYPYTTHTYPDSKRHREYLRHYQVREMDAGRFWRQIQRHGAAGEP